MSTPDAPAAELTRDRGVGLDRWRDLLAGLPPELALPYGGCRTPPPHRD
ncbi:hypothetical protein ACLQ29_01510 [Micromonospora sp. DT228]